MALTISTTPIALTYKYFPIGMVWERDIQVASTVSLVGKTIFYTPGQFLSGAGPEIGGTTCHECCRWIKTGYVGGSAVFVPMQLMGDDYDLKWMNVLVMIREVSTTQFRIRIEVVQTMDVGGVFRPNSINLSNSDRMLKNHRLNPAILDNTYPSFYNGAASIFRHRIDAGEDCAPGGGTMETVYLYDEMGGLFWNEGVNFYDYSITMEANSVPVSKISAIYPTTVTMWFKLDGAFAGIWTYFVGMFKTHNLNNGAPFFSDIVLHFGTPNTPLFNPATTWGDIPAGVFANGGAPVNVVGNLWKMTFEVLPDIIEEGGEYRLYSILGPDSETDDHEPWLYDTIIGGDDPEPPYGDVEWLIKTYHPDNTSGTTDCVTEVAAGERLYIRHRMDKASYELASGGTWANFIKVTVHFASFMPLDGFPLTSLGTITHIESDGAGYYQVEVEFYIPPSWRGTTKYVVFEWEFTTGIVYAGVYVSAPAYDPAITVQWYLNDLDNPISELCEGDEGGLIGMVTGDYLPDLYSPIGVIKYASSDDIISEFDGFNSTNLSKLTQGPITGAVRIGATGVYRYDINLTGLDTNNLCMLAILKKDTAVAPPLCPARDVELTIQWINVGFNTPSTLRITWNAIAPPVNFVSLSLQFVLGPLGGEAFALNDQPASGTYDYQFWWPLNYMTIQRLLIYRQGVCHMFEGWDPIDPPTLNVNNTYTETITFS